MWRTLGRGLGCVAYLGVLAVVGGLAAYLAFSLFVRRGETILPDLRGTAEANAAAVAADQGLRIEWTDLERFDETVPAGHVLTQQPRAGSLVKRGSLLRLTLSRGSQRVEVPAVVGETLLAAQVRLREAGLRVGRTTSLLTPDGGTGIVVLQNPRAGDLAEPTSPVDLGLAADAPGRVWIMPDLIDRSYDLVRGGLEARGFSFGRVAYEPYPGRSPGTVLRQFPLAGHPLRLSDPISLTVVAGDDSAESDSPP